ncbi:MAG: recombinase family protein [Bryobacteraceae bacterium]|jgi:site-specific DNA recombinase
MAVGIYVRVSTEEQRERQSILTQREFGLRYSDLHQLPIYETYPDDGVSGTVPIELRPGGIRLLEDARQHKFDQLLVYKLDRLGRDTRLILNAVAELEKHGVRVRSMTEEFDTATATGRLMLTMLSGFAAHERELIRERSVAGTNRLAEAGAWLGGVVPYGYRKNGEKGRARIVISEELIPGFKLSEADVVRTIYLMSASEKKSCQKIADYLNRAGIPCGSADNARGSEAGKRSRRIATIWRPSHVRNMIVSRTYMGQHLFGRRSANRYRKVIVREVPAIVAEQTWQAAQQVLQDNRIEASRNTRQPYLLRGLIKCGLCGLTFSGMRIKRQQDHYYRCNGRQQARGLYGINGKKCPARTLNGDYVERLVWADIESFLRYPGEILERLRKRLSMQDGERLRRQKEFDDLTGRLQQKATERERVLALFRRGRIDDATLDQQLDQVNAEAANLQNDIEAVKRELAAGDRTAQLQSAEALLETLRKRLDGPIPHDLKRRIVEILVEKIEAKTVERWGVQQSEITISYRFSQPDEPAALVLPRSHRLSNRKQAPEELNTLGDHLLRRRLVLKLLQRQVAEQIGVDKTSIANWEANRSKPGLLYMPAIIRFLGYNPLRVPTTWAERLAHARTLLGMSQRVAAAQIGVDQSTLARWERGDSEPAKSFLPRTLRFVSAVDQESREALSA